MGRALCLLHQEEAPVLCRRFYVRTYKKTKDNYSQLNNNDNDNNNNNNNKNNSDNNNNNNNIDIFTGSPCHMKFSVGPCISSTYNIYNLTEKCRLTP